MDACQSVLREPPRFLYPRLVPSIQTLMNWYVEDNPEYRKLRAAEAAGLRKQGLSQNEIAARYGVTVRTIRNWLSDHLLNP